jgi:hypothetical protein
VVRRQNVCCLCWFGRRKTLALPGPVQPREASYKTKPTGSDGPCRATEPKREKRRARVPRARLPFLLERVPRSSPKPFPRRRRRLRLNPFSRRHEDQPPRAGHGARCGSNPRPPHLLQPQRGLPRALLRGRPHQGMEPSELSVLALALGSKAMG